MTKLLRVCIVFLLFRIDWRKLIVFCSVLTVVSVLMQISKLPYPLTEKISPPNSEIASYNRNPMNTTVNLDKSWSLAVDVQLKSVRDAPAIVPLNSSAKLDRLLVIPNKTVRASQRRRNNSVNLFTLSPPSPTQTVKKLPRQLERYLSSLTPDETLAFVKRDIENSSLASDDDPELYAPLFRNISTFERELQERFLCGRGSNIETLFSMLSLIMKNGYIKANVRDSKEFPKCWDIENLRELRLRSYEWMEQLLKVYIYRDGKPPIFHHPKLSGIYSSEGWFMKLMEASRQFVTKDPEKAHLFYLPYSARQLQLALYVPNSHNLQPLSIFLRDYVNMLAAKYPFWNRTHGSDHFLVACHDWGPYTLKEHDELIRNTIKVLCNADASEGIFKAGKDVSLPETTISNPRRPLRNVGGRRVSQRPILAFFAGFDHGRVRPILLKHWRDKDEDMKIYGPLPKTVARIMSYPRHMKSSKYCICPMGYEVNSPRIVEAIYYECVPVIIADNLVPPLNDVLNWDAFSVTVAEKDIPKLKHILLAIPLKKYLTMQTNVKMLQKHFLWNAKPVRYDLFHMILHSIWSSRLKQIHLPQPS